MAFEKAHYLPILVALMFPITFVVTYYIAVTREDVGPLFPYISDTGTFSPESCIFGQMVNLGAMLMALIAYIRYLQLRDLDENNQLHHHVRTINSISFALGLIAAFGVSIVGNFQERNVLSVHLIGAILAFGVGGVYSSLQTYIAFKIYPLYGNKTLNWTRVLLSAGSLIFFVSTLAFATVAIKNAPKSKTHDKMHWKSGEDGWNYHFMSTLSEWLLCACQMLFFASFAYDFRRVSLTSINVSNVLK